MKRGHVDVSLCLRISFLLLILGTIGKECSASPRNNAQLNKTFLEEISASSEIPGTQVVKSRHKRSSIEAMFGHIFLNEFFQELDESNDSGVNISRPFPDGKLCRTGRDPPKRNETDIKRFRELMDKTTKNGAYIIYNFNTYENLNTGETKDHGWNCESQVCTFNLKEFNSVCGPLPPQNFTDGQSCIDGTKPMSKEEYAASGLLEMNGLKKDSRVHPDKVEDENGKAQRRYGKNCVSGKCHYSFHRGGYICGPSISPKLKPSPFLLGLFAVMLQTLLLKS